MAVGSIARGTSGGAPSPGGQADVERDLSALCEGAAVLSRADNRIAALALLRTAVSIGPADQRAHRRLAATLANAGDVDAAAGEYLRYVERLLDAGDVDRAALEIDYARATLGDLEPLRLTHEALSAALADEVHRHRRLRPPSRADRLRAIAPPADPSFGNVVAAIAAALALAAGGAMIGLGVGQLLIR